MLDSPQVKTRPPPSTDVGNPAGLATGKAAGLSAGEKSPPLSSNVGDPAGLATGDAAGEDTGLAIGDPTGLAIGDPTGLATGDPIGLAIGEPIGLAAGEVGLNTPVESLFAGDSTGEEIGDASGDSNPPERELIIGGGEGAILLLDPGGGLLNTFISHPQSFSFTTICGLFLFLLFLPYQLLPWYHPCELSPLLP